MGVKKSGLAMWRTNKTLGINPQVAPFNSGGLGGSWHNSQFSRSETDFSFYDSQEIRYFSNTYSVVHRLNKLIRHYLLITLLLTKTVHYQLETAFFPSPIKADKCPKLKHEHDRSVSKIGQTSQKQKPFTVFSGPMSRLKHH